MKVKDRKGVTLLELAIVLAIVAILATIGYPGLKRWYCRYKLQSFSSELFSHMQLARLFSMSYGYNTYVLFVPDKNFVVLYVDDIDNGDGAGKIDKDINDVDGDGDTTENESTHITFPLPNTAQASIVPPSRRRNLSQTDTVKGIQVDNGTCGIQFKRPDSVPKVPTASSTSDITFGSNQAEFMPDGSGKAGAVYISNCFGDTYAITVSVVGRVKLWKYEDGSWK